MLTAKLITQGGQSQQFKLSWGIGEMGPHNIKYPLSARVFLFDLFLFVCSVLFCFALFFQFKALLPGIVVFVPVPTRSLKLGTAWVFNNLQG